MQLFSVQNKVDNNDDCSQEMISDQCSVINQEVSQILPDIVNSVQQRISLDGSQRGITADDIRQIINLKLAQQAQQRIAHNSVDIFIPEKYNCYKITGKLKCNCFQYKIKYLNIDEIQVQDFSNGKGSFCPSHEIFLSSITEKGH
jgi:hypothetical protein